MGRAREATGLLNESLKTAGWPFGINVPCCCLFSNLLTWRALSVSLNDSCLQHMLGASDCSNCPANADSFRLNNDHLREELLMTPMTAMGKPRWRLVPHLASSHAAHRCYSLCLNLSVLTPGSFSKFSSSFSGCCMDWLEIT